MRTMTVAPGIAAVAALAVLAVLAPLPALAHAGHGDGVPGWGKEGWVTLALVLAGLWYALGLRRLPRRGRAGRAEAATLAAAFAAALLSLLVALDSPIDGIAGDLFSVHMAQHLILMLVAAPLLVRARPPLVLLWALPRGARRAWGRWWAGGRLARLHALLTGPVAAWVWFCGLFVFWHLPGPYGWAVRNEAVHVVEHAGFLAASCLFWAIVIEPSGRRRLDHGAAVLFVATAAILGGLPGALMVLTSHPFYTVHAGGVARWGLTLLEDQHLAGLIMWIPMGFAYLAAVLVLVARWLRMAERRGAARRRRGAALGSSLAVLLVLVLAGCGDETGERAAATRVPATFGGDAAHGAEQIVRTGCGSCHTIPGITGATAVVGPPLTAMGRRIFIAGMLRNTPDNMIRWLKDPQRIVPGNAMPNMGLKDQQARDIAAFLYTLQ